MTREEMIEVVLEHNLIHFVFARNTDDLENILRGGFTGYDRYSDKELKEYIDDWVEGEKEAKELLQSRRARQREELELDNTHAADPFS